MFTGITLPRRGSRTMAKHINSGRWTAQLAELPAGAPGDSDSDGAVLFLIGMRINRLRAVQRWLPVARQMPAMLKELARQPELGLLSARTFLSGRDVMVVQYWRSAGHLTAYARASEHLHLPAWRAFNAAARAQAGKGSPPVGVWHETYQVQASHFESTYVDLPPFGLAGALGVGVPAGRSEASVAA